MGLCEPTSLTYSYLGEERALRLLQQCNGDVQEALNRCRSEILAIQLDKDQSILKREKNDASDKSCIAHDIDSDIKYQSSRLLHSAHLWSNKDIQNIFPLLARWGSSIDYAIFLLERPFEIFGIYFAQLHLYLKLLITLFALFSLNLPRLRKLLASKASQTHKMGSIIADCCLLHYLFGEPSCEIKEVIRDPFGFKKVQSVIMKGRFICANNRPKDTNTTDTRKGIDIILLFDLYFLSTILFIFPFWWVSSKF
jgi:hypothetical protein